MATTALQSITTALALTASTAAFAGSTQFSLVGGGLVPSIDITLSVTESTTVGYDYDFVISNNTGPSTVTGVYFESLWNESLFGGSLLSSGDAAFLSVATSPDVDSWAGTAVSQEVNSERVYPGGRRVGVTPTYEPIVDQGIQEGESHTFSFAAVDGLTLQDIEDAIGEDGFNIAIRLHGDASDPDWGLADQIAGEEQIVLLASFIQTDEPGDDGDRYQETEVTSTPTPTAAVAGLAVLGALGLRRRR